MQYGDSKPCVHPTGGKVWTYSRGRSARPCFCWWRLFGRLGVFHTQVRMGAKAREGKNLATVHAVERQQSHRLKDGNRANPRLAVQRERSLWLGGWWSDDTAADSSANVLRPAASPLISLRYPPQRHRQEAMSACVPQRHNRERLQRVLLTARGRICSSWHAAKALLRLRKLHAQPDRPR